MSVTRIYVVIQKGEQEARRLVEATSASAAIRHCARNVYAAEVAATKDVAALMAAGTRVETADAETPKAVTP